MDDEEMFASMEDLDAKLGGGRDEMEEEDMGGEEGEGEEVEGEEAEEEGDAATKDEL